MMNENRIERIYQNDNFVFSDFNGLEMERLIVCEIPETKGVAVVFIKAKNRNWQRFFLDVGFGVWENLKELDEEEEGYNYIDKTGDFQLVGKKISKIWCEPDKINCRILITFETGEKLILRTIESECFDSESEFLILNSSD